ncbi:MAG: aspartate--tRNA(Asn) ligase [Chloroflexota bacterium]|nr:aspartate--tRNA(Asn) ligase [Chloroflexota bacterium]
METIRTTDLAGHLGERVRLHGWLHQTRRMGGVNFVLLRDGYGIAQAVAADPAALAPLQGLGVETVIALEGRVVAEAQARGGVELHDPVVQVITPVAEALPFPINKPALTTTLDTFLDHAPLGLRHPAKRALFRVQAGIMAAFRATLDAAGFTEIQSPKLLAAASESGAGVFPVDYFGRRAFLAQSPQFYKQLMVGVFERVYEVGPVFRAEAHHTSRHVNEYVSLDAEMGFITDHTTVMALLTVVLRGIMAHLGDQHASDLTLLGVTLPAVPEPIPQITFQAAQTLIWQQTGEDCRGEPDLAPAHERTLGAWAAATHGSDFLFVTGYPMSKRPFYTQPNPADPAYSNSFDLLLRGTELVTGGQRLHRYSDYLAALAQAGLAPEPFAGYLAAMLYGMPPHGGFAIGLERFVQQLAGLSNIREATLFPRDGARLAP